MLQNPVGYNRVYVQLDGDLSWEKWWDGLRAGRCFVSNGPLLRCRANGQLPGHVFTSNSPQEIEIEAKLTTRDPISAIEIIVNGKVERTVSFDEWQQTGKLGKVKFTQSGWFLVRTITDNAKTFRFASTAPFYIEIGANKHRISRSSAQFFLDWVHKRIEQIKISDRLTDPIQREEVLTWHHPAEKFWQGKVAEANTD